MLIRHELALLLGWLLIILGLTAPDQRAVPLHIQEGSAVFYELFERAEMEVLSSGATVCWRCWELLVDGGVHLSQDTIGQKARCTIETHARYTLVTLSPTRQSTPLSTDAQH